MTQISALNLYEKEGVPLENMLKYNSIYHRSEKNSGESSRLVSKSGHNLHVLRATCSYSSSDIWVGALYNPTHDWHIPWQYLCMQVKYSTTHLTFDSQGKQGRVFT